MRFLSPQPQAELGVYYAAAESLGRPAIAQFETELLDRFRLFDERVGRLHTIKRATKPLADLHDDLKHLYDSRSAEVQELKATLRERYAPGCPYCGEYCSTPEIDHYLPRTKYGEYSLFSPNLVPSCGPCNRAISDRIATDDDFLYPFADDFLQHPVIRVRFDWSLPPVAIRLELDEELPDPNRHRVERHLRLLRIPNRFAAWAVGELARYRRLYAGWAKQDIAADLERQEASYRPTPGPNLWPAMLAYGARNDETMLAFLAMPEAALPS